MSWTKEIDGVLKKAGDPHLAAIQWGRFQKLGLVLSPSHPLLSLFGNSRVLVDSLLGDRKLAEGLIHDSALFKPKGRALLDRELKALFSRIPKRNTLKAMQTLRRFRIREVIRIAACDLSGQVPFEGVGRELSDLAESVLKGALQTASHQSRLTLSKKTPFVVIGLGKLGGQDLNFSSDIDLFYVFQAANSKAYTRLAEDLTRIVQEKTGDGFAFRVDLNLRPEGRNGPLLNSLDSLVFYHETSAAGWERAAMTKARPVAGDSSLGCKVVQSLKPFLYHRNLDASITNDLKKIKMRINEEMMAVTKKRNTGYHVKLGMGGIREIEFFVTAFQLIYGGKEGRLQETNTLQLLQTLVSLGLLPKEEAERLKKAYIFLRRIENRLQMMEDRQVHTLPTEEQELLSLARRMGFEDRMAFLQSLKEQTRFVEECFERLSP